MPILNNRSLIQEKLDRFTKLT